MMLDVSDSEWLRLRALGDGPAIRHLCRIWRESEAVCAWARATRPNDRTMGHYRRWARKRLMREIRKVLA